jgi:hypothetical protein
MHGTPHYIDCRRAALACTAWHEAVASGNLPQYL